MISKPKAAAIFTAILLFGGLSYTIYIQMIMVSRDNIEHHLLGDTHTSTSTSPPQIAIRDAMFVSGTSIAVQNLVAIPETFADVQHTDAEWLQAMRSDRLQQIEWFTEGFSPKYEALLHNGHHVIIKPVIEEELAEQHIELPTINFYRYAQQWLLLFANGTL
jgi:hypothetical protein